MLTIELEGCMQGMPLPRYQDPHDRCCHSYRILKDGHPVRSGKRLHGTREERLSLPGTFCIEWTIDDVYVGKSHGSYTYQTRIWKRKSVEVRAPTGQMSAVLSE